jgi:large subunit ribosomal protein L31
LPAAVSFAHRQAPEALGRAARPAINPGRGDRGHADMKFLRVGAEVADDRVEIQRIDPSAAWGLGESVQRQRGFSVLMDDGLDNARLFFIISGSSAMKADIHPNYREVVFQDLSSDLVFKTRSTVQTKETIEFEGAEYPLVKVEVSSKSHPFYTGKHKIMDTGGRVDKFKKRYGK